MISVLGNVEHEKMLMEAVQLYGEGRWSEIARALKIQGLAISSPDQLYHDWQMLNPNNKKITATQIKDLVIFGIQAKGIPRIFVAKWKSIHGRNYQLVSKLKSIFVNTIQYYLRHLIKILSRKKSQLRKRIKRIGITIFNNFMAVGSYKSDDELCKQIIANTALISELLLQFNQHYNKPPGEQYYIYTKITNKQKFDTALEHMILIDYLTRIKRQKIHFDRQLEGKCKYLKQTIQENKDSAIYKLLFPISQYQKFYELYNDAVLNNPKDFVFDASKIKKGNAIPQHLQQVKPQKLLTVRGRIRNKDKFLFRSQHSERFTTDLLNNLDDDQESNEEIRKHLDQDQLQELSDAQPTIEQCEQELKENPRMKQYVDQNLINLKVYAYNKYKDSDILALQQQLN